MRILVTGSAGLIGRELVKYADCRSVSVVRFDISEGQDICDPTAVAEAIRGCDGVIHLAAISRVAWGEAHPRLCHQVNVDGTAQVISAALARKTPPWVVFASSREVYGDPKVVPVREGDAAINPVNHYGRSKAEGEALFAQAQTQGLRCSIVRLSNVYGTVHDHPDRAVPSLLWRAKLGEDLELSGVDAYFDFVHVDDTVQGLFLAAEQLEAGQRYLDTVHLATGVATTLGALARKVCDVARSNSRIEVLPARSFDVKGFCGDPTHASRILGWAAETGLDEGLERLYQVLEVRNRPMDPVHVPVLEERTK